MATNNSLSTDATRHFFDSRGLNYVSKYVDSLFIMQALMNTSYCIVIEGYKKRLEVRDQEEAVAFHTMNHSPQKSYTFTKEKLMEMKRKSSVSIFDQEISNAVLLKKEAYDFFHYARVCIETVAQMVNQAVIAEPLEIKCVSFKTVQAELNRCMSESVISNLFNNMEHNPIYNYLCEFDNNIKHNGLIGLNLETSIILGKDKFTINSFSDRRGTSYSSCDAIKKIKETFNYVNDRAEEARTIIMDMISEAEEAQFSMRNQ